MYRIAKCDDDPMLCSQIEQIILNCRIKITQPLEVDVYFSGEEFHQYLREGTYYDMVFLDIEMRKLNGIELGKKIRNELRNETVQIVYISGKDSYAMDLFEVRPMNFLVKPIRADRIVSVLEKGVELSNKLNHTFQYKQGHNIVKIEIKDILYFESKGRKIRMVTLDGEDIFYGALADIHERVEGYGFFFCHKSYLVNYQHILKFEFDKLIVKKSIVLPISQQKRKIVRQMQMKLEMEEVINIKS